MEKNKICLRCGEKFTILKSHLYRKTICNPIYLNINADEMLKNYKTHYTDYVVKRLNSAYYCPKKCGKVYKYHSGLYKHKKTCTYQAPTQNHSALIDNTINISDVSPINITANSHNNSNNNNDNTIENANIYNITLQNYGEEIMPPNLEELLTVIKNDLRKTQGRWLLQEIFEFLHVTTKENRNMVVRDDKNRCVEIYKDNKWNVIDKKQLKPLLVGDVRNRVLSLIAAANDKFTDKIRKEILKTAKNCYTVDTDEMTDNNFFGILMTVLYNNREELLNYNKASKKGNIVKSDKKTMSKYTEDSVKLANQAANQAAKQTTNSETNHPNYQAYDVYVNNDDSDSDSNSGLNSYTDSDLDSDSDSDRPKNNYEENLFEYMAKYNIGDKNVITESVITDKDKDILIHKIINGEKIEENDTQIGMEDKLSTILGENYLLYICEKILKEDIISIIKNY